MYQKNIVITGKDNLLSKLPYLTREFDSYGYRNGAIEIGIGNMPEDEIADTLAVLKNSFPKLSIIGLSSVNIRYFCDDIGENDACMTLKFMLMRDSVCEAFYRSFDKMDTDLKNQVHDYAVEMREQIKQMKDVCCIEVFMAKINVATSGFISEFSKGLEEIPIFGAVASANSGQFQQGAVAVSNTDSIIISGDWIGSGVSILVYRGSDLYCYVDYVFGWEPIGRYMDVCARDVSDRATVTVFEIDNQKPVDVYKKYLGVRTNKVFINNISEFPLIVERNGLYIGRTPSGVGENGEVYLEGDILEGEKVRFSFGEHDEILNGTRNAAERMNTFGPEALSLVICGNRFNFLQDEYKLEIEYYAEGRKEKPALLLGMGEIYQYHGKGGVLNSALVAVGMREGLGDEKMAPIKSITQIHHHDEVVPLSERMSHFLKAMTGELVDAVKEAKAANEAKSAFLSNMSHEIRTPINAVLGMDEMILRECDDPRILEYAQNIKTAGNTLLGIINDVLDFSKIEAGKLDIIPVDYDFSSVINDLIHMIKPRAEGKKLELIADIDPTIPSVLNGDEIRIKQVITNILTNAVKYTEKGSITLRINYEKISGDEIEFNISVRDTGIGIREEDIKRMRGAFQRVDETRNRNIEGTGLGLNITEKLLGLMGTKLEVKSVYGEGSEFFFKLRQRVVKWEPIGDYMECYRKALEGRSVYHERFNAPDAKILVVDDTAMNLTVFEGLLKKTRIQIDTAMSGRECLEMTRTKKYDIIFLDHRMPEMDGIETLEHLKSENDNPNKDTITVSLTANAVSGAREKYIAAGFNEYLTKPIMADKLESLLINYLPPEKVNKVEGELEKETVDLRTLPPWIRKVAEFHLEQGIENCGSVEGYIDAVKSFADAAEDTYSDINRYFEGQDIENYTIRVHALKSSARIIGAMELSLLAEKLEKAGDGKNVDFITRETPKLLEMYKNIIDTFETEMDDEGDDKTLPEMKPDQLEEAKNAMKEVAGSFDYDSIKYIMETIKQYRVPESEKKRIRELHKAILKADWDKIKQLLEMH